MAKIHTKNDTISSRYYQRLGHTISSIQSINEAILVYIPGNSDPQLTPNETIPTIVDKPVLASFRNSGPPLSPWQASLLSMGFIAHICVSLNARKLAVFERRLYSTNVWLHLSNGTFVTFVFSKISERFVPKK